MWKRIVAIGILLLLCATAPVTAQSGQTLYDQGVNLEKAGKCTDAIKLFERVVKNSSSDRSLVAKANLQWGTCLVNLGEATRTKGLDILNYVIKTFKNDKDLVSVVDEANKMIALMQRAAPVPAWTKNDKLLVAEFENSTGNPAFDGYLHVILTRQLAQSPYLDILPYDRLREALTRLGYPPDGRVTHAHAQDVCGNAGVKANLLPSIVGSEGHYKLTLDVVSCTDNGKVITSRQTELASWEDVMSQLPKAALLLRADLGESEESIRKFDSLRTVTTNLPQALKEYMEAYKLRMAGDLQPAMTALNRATKLDPNFASAYAIETFGVSNTLDRKNATTAFGLRDRVSGQERLFIEAVYQATVLGNLEKTIHTLEDLRNVDPRDVDVRLLLGDQYRATGRLEAALKELQEVVRLSPADASARESLFRNYIELNKLKEAHAVFKAAAGDGTDTTLGIHTARYGLAFMEADKKGMSDEVLWASFKFVGYQIPMFNARAAEAAYAGKLLNAQKLWDEKVKSSATDGKAYRFSMEAVTKALFGDVDDSRELAKQALALSHAPRILSSALVVYGLAGDSANVKILADEIHAQHPENTFLNLIWLPTATAGLDIQGGNGGVAIKRLEAAKPYEPSANSLWAIYVRGLAYLQTKSGRAAAAEFQKILDHRGVDPLSPLYPVSHLRLAEAYTLTGNLEQARKSYQAFFELWKNADKDVPVLLEAQAKFKALPGN